ncbi:signal peptidase I [Blautia ammoniilytica]|uniref:Signal peptidase I n=1 Tax=Blautia ammoniilytica TaxID=2981782 RepID=A0ABT2TPU0_9FIRM|nr:signal peptidase I [Blautia ammoniilytica]MCU6764239.1 signal peptidase I [Blautia ammoniilytica]SCH23124.1 Signal peptidase I W [uncultured Blautia sp.]
MKQTQEKEKSSLGHKILTGIGIILCVILIPILVINCTLIIKSYTNKDQVPSISGIFPMIILTDSMYPEFESGDLIVCNTAEPEEIKVGDVICFYDPAGNGTATVTHRVQEVVTDDEGNLAWITKGDANNTEDLPTVPAKNLIGVYKTRLKGLGNVAMFMQTTQGLIICVICPIILLVAYDVIRRRAYEKSKKKDTDALLAELEALRAEKEKNNPKDI